MCIYICVYVYMYIYIQLYSVIYLSIYIYLCICSIRMYVHTLPLLTLGPCLVTWNSSARAREGAAQKRPEDVSANDVDVTSNMGDLQLIYPANFGGCDQPLSPVCI